MRDFQPRGLLRTHLSTWGAAIFYVVRVFLGPGPSRGGLSLILTSPLEHRLAVSLSAATSLWEAVIATACGNGSLALFEQPPLMLFLPVRAAASLARGTPQALRAHSLPGLHRGCAGAAAAWPKHALSILPSPKILRFRHAALWELLPSIMAKRGSGRGGDS